MTLITPEYLQTKKYSAKRDRVALAHGGAVQAGVWDNGDFKVTWTSNMNLSVAAGFALVQASNAGNLGLYHVQNDAAITVVIPPAHASLPRLDQVYILVDDSTDGAASDDNPQLLVAQGTPTSGATLDNRSGFAALPNNALRIADVLVPAAASTLSAAAVRDRRPWARGANALLTVQSGTLTGLGSTTAAEISSNFRTRIELSGNPMRIIFAPGYVQASSPVTPTIEFMPWLDGAAAGPRLYGQGTNNSAIFNGNPFVFLLTAQNSSRLVSIGYIAAGSGSWSIGADSSRPTNILIEETPRMNGNNN